MRLLGILIHSTISETHWKVFGVERSAIAVTKSSWRQKMPNWRSALLLIVIWYAHTPESVFAEEGTK